MQIKIIFSYVVGYSDLLHHETKGRYKDMKILHLNAGNETGGGMYHILHLLQSLDREKFVLGVFEKGELLERANQAGIHTVYFPCKTRMSIPLLRKIAVYLKKEQISMIHTHGPRANVYVSMMKKFISFHWIVTIHSHPQFDFMDKGIYGSLLSRLNMRAIKKADRMITVSDELQDSIKKLGIKQTRISSSFNGINFNEHIDLSYERRDFGISPDDFLILMVARLEQVKGHEIAFQAFAKLRKEKQNCQLLLIGDGSLHQPLRGLANQLGIGHQVHFLGHRDDVDQFYQMADVTLLTSFSEGFPLVLLESARMKTPVIATDVGDVSKIVIDQSHGWKVKVGDVDQLVNIMKEAMFLKQKGILPEIGNRLYAYTSTRFSQKAFAENIYNVYLGVEDVN